MYRRCSGRLVAKEAGELKDVQYHPPESREILPATAMMFMTDMVHAARTGTIGLWFPSFLHQDLEIET